jgi:hypothetical protein
MRDLEHMIAAEEFVTGPCAAASIIIHFPFPRRQRCQLTPARPDEGFQRRELCTLVSSAFEKAFLEAWIEARKVELHKTPTLDRFAISGFTLRDLLLRSLLWDPGLQEISCEIDH